jgi:hypothetical protein
MTRRSLRTAGAWVLALAALGAGERWFSGAAEAQAGGRVSAPAFEVDPVWPKPLPNHWILGSAIGVWVDKTDHIWIIHRGASTLDPNENALGGKLSKNCCQAAPPVLEFDQDGNLVQSWGGPGQGYVWIAGNGSHDGQLLKFTRDGKFIKQFGFAWANAGSTDTFAFRQPAKIFVDEPNKEAYIADGYGNHRVVVLDSDSGKVKRLWGAYGNVPDDKDPGRYRPNDPPAQQFRNPVHCADKSVDNLVYVCDRVNDRLQVFKPDGTFVKEQFYEKETLGSGSVWDIAFSKDPQQKYIFLADGMNQRINVIERQTLQVVTSFGDGGRGVGQFFGVHSIAIDSKGNLYTTETWEGKRLQKFAYKGLKQVTAGYQGVVRPGATGK